MHIEKIIKKTKEVLSVQFRIMAPSGGEVKVVFQEEQTWLQDVDIVSFGEQAW